MGKRSEGDWQSEWKVGGGFKMATKEVVEDSNWPQDDRFSTRQGTSWWLKEKGFFFGTLLSCILLNVFIVFA